LRAGRLDREITVERVETSVDDAGSPQETWSTHLELRAELLDGGEAEVERAWGASTEVELVLRTRYVDDVTLADRIVYEDRPYEIVRIRELGRRRGLEIGLRSVGP